MVQRTDYKTILAKCERPLNVLCIDLTTTPAAVWFRPPVFFAVSGSLSLWLSRPGLDVIYADATAILRGLTFSCFGIVTANTPPLVVAEMLSSLAVSGSVNVGGRPPICG